MSRIQVEADLDLLDEAGEVLLTVTGLRLGTGVSEAGQRDRTLQDRLLTIDWARRDLPEAEAAGAAPWLVVGLSETDTVPSGVAAALSAEHAEVVTAAWTPTDDHEARAQWLRTTLTARAFGGVVVVAAPSGDVDDDTPRRGADVVRAPEFGKDPSTSTPPLRLSKPKSEA